MDKQGALDSKRLVFIDESGAKTNMIRLYGRALRGERVYDSAPHGHWCATTMISSIRSDGSTACMTISGATTGEIFRLYVEKVLLPSLSKGDILILDNLSAHKDKLALLALEEAGIETRFLPPYSPDFNPIEKMWSKVKQILRSKKARTERALSKAIALALKSVTESDAKGWFKSCGYSFI